MRLGRYAAWAAAGALVIVIATVNLSSGSARAAGAAMKLSPSSQNVSSTAAAVKVDVTLEAGAGVAAFDFTLSYDENLLELQSVATGDFLATSGSTPSCYQGNEDNFPTGLVNFGCAIIGTNPPGASGNGLLATITFKPKATGTSPLVYIHYGLADGFGESLGADADDGIVKIVQPGSEDDEPLAATPTVNAGARTPTGRPPVERDPLVLDGTTSAATPVPGTSTASGSSGPTGTISDPPSGSVAGQDAPSDGNAAPGATGPGGAPVAGTGYRTEVRSPWWQVLYAMLALGAGALLGGATLKAKKAR